MVPSTATAPSACTRTATAMVEPSTTLVHLFRDRVNGFPQRPALRFHDGEGWSTLSWHQYGGAVEEIAAGLTRLGVMAGDRVAILAGNRPEWHEADMAILSAGAASVPAYPTSASGQVSYLLEHSGARLCFVGDRDQLAKVLLRRHRMADLEHVVIFEAMPDGLDDDFVLTLDDLRALGRDVLTSEPDVVADRVSAITPQSIATIVYTSGTTGPPKGAVLTFGNLAATIEAITTVVPIGPDDRFLSFLPLSHIAERTVSHFGQIVSGGETWFARSLSTVADDLAACRPTVFFAVPRVWEKFEEGIRAQVDASPRPVRRLLRGYLNVNDAWVDARRAGSRRVIEAAGHALLDLLVGRRIRARLGLDRARVLVSGAAPIHPDLLWWFRGFGLDIGEVYGQTEDCGPTTMNEPGHIRVGSVGRPVPGLEVRISDDTEILVRGPSVCSGYYRDPERTRELIDDEGWMHSGDLGRIDADGYVYITGRKKDLIITSSGKNIAPQLLETALCSQPLIAQAVVIGDGRSYLTALIALDSEELAHWAEMRGRLADLGALLADADVHAEVASAVTLVNDTLSPIEQIKSWRIIPRELTVAGGELTPTLKVKRDIVATRYGDLIDEMYV